MVENDEISQAPQEHQGNTEASVDNPLLVTSSSPLLHQDLSDRSVHLDGKPGFYEGRPIEHRYVHLPAIEVMKPDAKRA